MEITKVMTKKDELIELAAWLLVGCKLTKDEAVIELNKLIDSIALIEESPLEKEERIKRKEIKFRNNVFLSAGNYNENMLRKFCDYWTEKNCRGKMRYEFEKTFEISRRLATWASRDTSILKKPEADQITYKEMIDRFNKGETAIQEQYEPVTPGDKRTLWKRK